MAKLFVNLIPVYLYVGLKVLRGNKATGLPNLKKGFFYFLAFLYIGAFLAMIEYLSSMLYTFITTILRFSLFKE
jgi:hypothetical protein